MISETPDSIERRAEAIVAQLTRLNAAVSLGSSVIGGGSTPEQAIETWLIAISAPDVVDPSAGCARIHRR